jgi:hypothetical protein
MILVASGMAWALRNWSNCGGIKSTTPDLGCMCGA